MANRQNSIGQKFQKNVNKCDICFSSYDRTLHQPVIICSMHHTICRDCMKSLQSSRQCPFCREAIKFDKIVINNYIYELLPKQTTQANVRQQYAPAPQANKNQWEKPSQNYQSNNQYPSNQSYSNPYSNQYNPQQPTQPHPPTTSINNQPQQQVYPQHYQEQIGYYSEDSRHSLESNMTVYKLIFFIQIPLTLANLLFAILSPQSQCMDKPHNSTVYVARPWFLSMGITELVLMVALLMQILLYYWRCITRESMNCGHYVLGFIAAVKIVVWAIIELGLFTYGISKFCSGGIYAYGLFLAIIHGIMLGILCCVSAIKR